MAWDPEISQRLHSAYRDGKVEEFKETLLSHPEYLRDEDGTDCWMWKAAIDGRMSIIQAVVELGVDVNETHDARDENDPFFEPEGPILQAATNGNVNIVRWLLSHGAKINYVVNGMPRCLPLIRAATEGHLEVVKMLVECGADIHSTWNGLNAVTQAEMLGHFDVRDYLLSVKDR